MIWDDSIVAQGPAIKVNAEIAKAADVTLKRGLCLHRRLSAPNAPEAIAADSTAEDAAFPYDP